MRANTRVAVCIGANTASNGLSARAVLSVVAAEAHGQWAVHRDPGVPFSSRDGEPFSVTHIPSGMRIAGDMAKPEARFLAQKLAKMFPDITLVGLAEGESRTAFEVELNALLRRKVRA